MAVLVKFSKDWADEFEVINFYAHRDKTAEEERQNVLAEIEKGEAGFSFGSNEEFDNEEMSIDDYEFTDITKEEFNTLYNLFNGRRGFYVSYGTGI